MRAIFLDSPTNIPTAWRAAGPIQNRFGYLSNIAQTVFSQPTTIRCGRVFWNKSGMYRNTREEC
jgi:hypothetical protein